MVVVINQTEALLVTAETESTGGTYNNVKIMRRPNIKLSACQKRGGMIFQSQHKNKAAKIVTTQQEKKRLPIGQN